MGMLLVVFLFFVNVFGKENFKVQGLNGVTTSQALSQCFTAGLCTSATGCCNGHGVCTATNTTQYCVCGAPQDCRSGLSVANYPNYTGSTCDSVAITPGCCQDGSDDYIFAKSGVCYKRNGTDAESGSKGRLLKRLGSANYNDSYGSLQDSLSQIYSWQNDLLTSGTVKLTQFNMMTLGFLQVALKDAVHLCYYPISEQNITFNGTTYPKVKPQNNTGVSGSPKAFENAATAVVDVGPLYDYASTVGSGPYIDVTPAVTYWSGTHHMTNEFIVALKFLGLYHNYVAGNVEDFFCGAHSTNTTTQNNTCTIPVAKLYDLARKSTIRFFGTLLQTAPLYIGIENPTVLDGLEEGYFFTWWWRDSTTSPTGAGVYQEIFDKIRTGAEFSDGITYTNLDHHLISALDFFISARNPNTNTTAYATFGSSSPCGFNPANIVYPGGNTPATIVADVFNLFHTPTQRWGSKIHSSYAAETALLLYRATELGLSSYKSVLSSLTDSVSSSDISTNQNVFYGIHKDQNAARKYQNTTAFVALAANIVHLNDIIMTDRTGNFAIDSDLLWTSRNFHPDPSLIQSPDYEFANCYKGGGSSCTNTALRGAGVLTSQILESLNPAFSSANTAWFTRGALNAGIEEYIAPHEWDQWSKENAGFPLLTEIINPLFYQYNGALSMAFKYCDSDNYFLPNVMTDAFPSAIGWSGYLDGYCWTTALINGPPACSRSATSMGNPNCLCFYFPTPPS